MKVKKKEKKMTNYNEILENLEILELNKIRNILPTYLDGVASSPPHLIDSLKYLLKEEIKERKRMSAQGVIKTAAFPFVKTLEEYDYDFQPTIDKNYIKDLSTLRFIENNENILFIGSPGVGKTHLAVALGVEAAKKSYSVYFINCHKLIMKLSKAHKENRLEKVLNNMKRHKVLIIDEIGYLPLDKNGTNLFFQLIASRYMTRTTIITSNMHFNRWGEVFNDDTISAAILDRLLHHSHVVNIKGPSYRLKDKIESAKKVNNNEIN